MIASAQLFGEESSCFAFSVFMTLFICECSKISAYAHVGGKEMHHVCLRAENKEGIFLPYGKFLLLSV